MLGHALSLNEVGYSLQTTTMTLRSGDSFWLDNVWLVVLLSSMFASKLLTLGHCPPISDGFYEMTIYARHVLFIYYLALRAYPSWDDAFILGHSHLADFLHWDSTSYLWSLLLMDHRVVDTLGSDFSTYLARLGYPLSFVTHSYILHSAPLYLHPSCQSLTSFEPTYFIILHGFIPFFWSKEDVD